MLSNADKPLGDEFAHPGAAGLFGSPSVNYMTCDIVPMLQTGWISMAMA